MKRSRNKFDIQKWAIKVIESCVSLEQLVACRRLRQQLWGIDDSSWYIVPIDRAIEAQESIIKRKKKKQDEIIESQPK